MPVLRALPALLLAACLVALATPPAQAQYFGRNKVQYDDFEFRVLETEHFDIYYYPEAEQGVRDAARMAERWYARLSRILGHEFESRKHIILYADDADFQQTNVIGGLIGEGTGGVTEGFKLRVVMPLTGSYADTDHVLGHELVHQFQYDIAQRGGGFANFVRLPLWIVEGMAEYFSVGREDVHTAMWLRDAVLRDAFPTLRQLSTDPRYFPYRYGQAFWAWVGGTYGDEAAVTLFRNALQIPLDSAIVSVTGLSPDSLSARWAREVATTYLPLMAGRTAPPYAGEDVSAERLDSLGLAPLDGRRVLARELGAGTTNLAPVLSPDGRYVAFLSERDLFGIDLFLADARTGQILKKLQSVESDPHLDALRFINSAGTWSPDGQKFAFVVFVEGDNEIAVLDVGTREIERRIRVRDVDALRDPAWSPDGRTLAFTGMRGGLADLYLVDIEGGTARQLTNDRHMDMQPAWSPDGRTLAFSTDRGPGTSFERLTYARPRLALYDLETGEISLLSLFAGAKHINPQFSPDGESLFFVSDRGGFSNVYRTDLTTGEVFQVTNAATGVSGITDLSPTMSVAAQTGAMMYTVFEAQNYNVYAREPEETVGVPVAEAVAAQTPGTELGTEPLAEEPAGPDTTDAAAPAAGVLPPLAGVTRSRVETYLADASTGLPDTRAFPDRAYRPKLQLDYVAQAPIGASYDPYYGAGFAGGVALRFSDVLGNRVLGAVIQANGTFKDIGGQVVYLNQRRRLNWGGYAGHIPFLQIYTTLDEVDGTEGDPSCDNPTTPEPDPCLFPTRLYQRTYLTEVGGLAAYPLSQTRRFEGNAGYRRIGYGFEIDDLFIDGRGIRVRRENIDTNVETIHLGEAGVAYVGDYSFFGFTSPVRGGRYRLGVTGTAGSLTLATVTADYRRYLFVRPFFTLAARGLHFGRYGPDAQSGRLYPLFLGYGTLVRGYRVGSFETQEDYNEMIGRLFGSRIGVASVEVRMPLFGIREFGLINFPYLPTELVLFGDAGMAWGQFSELRIVSGEGQQISEIPIGTAFGDQKPIFSAGAAARVNLLGALILEFYYAFPFSREDRSGVFGVNLSPGW